MGSFPFGDESSSGLSIYIDVDYYMIDKNLASFGCNRKYFSCLLNSEFDRAFVIRTWHINIVTKFQGQISYGSPESLRGVCLDGFPIHCNGPHVL